PLRLIDRSVRKRLDIAGAEAAVAAGSDERRVQQTTRDRTRHRRLAHAKADRHIPRTDQSVQGVVLRLTNPYQKAVALLHWFELDAWNLPSGAVVSSLKMCIDRRAYRYIPCQTFRCAIARWAFRKGRNNS